MIGVVKQVDVCQLEQRVLPVFSLLVRLDTTWFCVIGVYSLLHIRGAREKIRHVSRKRLPVLRDFSNVFGLKFVECVKLA